MPLPQQKFREIVYQILFSCDFGQDDLRETSLMLMREARITKRTVLQAYERVQSVVAHLPAIDHHIRESSKEYTLERISSAEKNAIRLGVFELFYDEKVPWKVALAEAVRLTRKFGTPEGADFVNALLDVIYAVGAPSLAQ